MLGEYVMRTRDLLAREAGALRDLAYSLARAAAGPKSHGALCVVDMSGVFRAEENASNWEKLTWG